MEKKKNGLTSDLLKWIAVVTMFIDHIGAAIVEQTDLSLLPYGKTGDLILRLIGRIAFPIYCFLLVEGFYHTRSRKKYLCNLTLFAVLSEIPFELAVFGEIKWGFHNVYWTLLLGFLVMSGVEKIREKMGTTENTKKTFAELALAAAAAIGAELLQTDYGAIGVFLIFILYQARENRQRQCILGAVAMAYEVTAPVAFYLLYHYNGIRRQKRWKYFFYAFYPVHFLLLYWIRVQFPVWGAFLF